MGTTVQIHVVNIQEVNPGPIQCMSLNERTFKLALFRGGNEPAIELWDVSHLPFRETVLTDLEKVDENVSVESIVWVKDRLFSCGLHGFVLEHDLTSGLIKGKTAATSGPVWCLGVSSNELFLAAGTEDGFVNIFQVFDDGLVYLKVLDRQEGRHLCLSWSPCGDYIATGSIDSLRLWDVEKGHALQRLMTGRSKNTETIVWSVLLLEDFMIVTGDSRGIVSFWDGRIGVLKHKIISHKADILCLKLSSDQRSIYAAGVDPSVVLLVRLGKSDKWVKSHQRNMHTNDVMCLATHGNRLFSAGIDADLVMSSFPPKIVTKYPPLPKPQRISVSRTSKQVLVQNGRGLDLWRLPGDNQDLLKLVELGSHRLDVINSSSTSPTGYFFAYSTDDKINFFRLSTATGSGSTGPHLKTPNLKKLSSHVSNEIENLLPVSSLQFLNETLVLAVSASKSNIAFIEIDPQLDNFTCKRIHEITDAHDISRIITLVAAVTLGEFHCVALANFGNSVVTIFKFRAGDLGLSGKPRAVPRYRCQPTAITFHPTLPYLMIAYVDHSIKVFNFSCGKIIYDEKIGSKHGAGCSLQPVLSATWSMSGDRVVLHEVDKLYLMKVEDGDGDGGGGLTKRTKRSKDSDKDNCEDEENSILTSTDDERLNFSVQTCENKYKFLTFSGFLDDGNELLVVEVKPSTLLENLPPAFAKKRFGM